MSTISQVGMKREGRILRLKIHVPLALWHHAQWIIQLSFPRILFPNPYPMETAPADASREMGMELVPCVRLCLFLRLWLVRLASILGRAMKSISVIVERSC